MIKRKLYVLAPTEEDLPSTQKSSQLFAPRVYKLNPLSVVVTYYLDDKCNYSYTVPKSDPNNKRLTRMHLFKLLEHRKTTLT
jgi:hypothetical protein